MTEATAIHRIPEGLSQEEESDAAEFLDMDLSILGASQTAFDAYDHAIRREYRHVPWPLYGLARRKVLAGFLERKHLYVSDWGRASFEDRARANLGRKLGLHKREAGY